MNGLMELPLVWLLIVLLVLGLLRFFSTYNPRNCQTGVTRCTKREMQLPDKYYEYDLQGKHIFERSWLQTIAERNMLEMPMIFWKKKECLWVVMEPVGLPKTGQVACRIALEHILYLYQEKEDMSPKVFLKKACFQAHRNISENINQGSSGCSVALIYITGGRCYWASCGDIGIFQCDEELV